MPETERGGLQFEEVDIALDAELMSVYAERIPVLRCSDRTTELAWPFDRVAVRMFLQRDDD